MTVHGQDLFINQLILFNIFFFACFPYPVFYSFFFRTTELRAALEGTDNIVFLTLPEILMAS